METIINLNKNAPGDKTILDKLQKGCVVSIHIDWQEVKMKVVLVEPSGTDVRVKLVEC